MTPGLGCRGCLPYNARVDRPREGECAKASPSRIPGVRNQTALRRFALFLFLVTAVVPRPALAGASADRGWLNLAWDAHDAGLFDEALSYLREIPADSELGADAAWLKAECLYDMGRYAEAAEVLRSPVASGLEDRAAFLRDVYWDWAWDEWAAGRPDGAAEVAGRFLEAAPGDPYASALAAVARFRVRLADALAGRSAPVEVRWAVPGEAPGPGWVRAHPWDPASPWAPEVTWDDWVPAEPLTPAREGRVAWVRMEPAAIDRALAAALPRIPGSAVRPDEGGFRVGSGAAEVWVDTGEWRFRAAVEALGPEGAAALAAARAWEALEAQAGLARWVEGHRGGLEAEVGEGQVRIRHPDTGRTFLLDLGAWADWFRDDPEGWEAFWGDLRAELGRPPRPYRCFCGKPVVLREAPVADPGDALVWERSGGHPIVLLALCPDHVQYVTQRLLEEWGVGLRDVAERVRSDAAEAEWRLTFRRDGNRILLEGEGAAGLARWPELLLGALEQVEGRGVRGREVRVVAPTSRALVVLPAQAGPAAEEGAVRWGLKASGGSGDRIHLGARVRLPHRPQGRFRVSPSP